MNQFVVTHKNGVELNKPLGIGLDEEKMVKVYSKNGDGASPSIVEYAEIDNRRINVVSYEIALIPSTIVALIAETYAVNIDKNNTLFPVDVNTKFIGQMVDSEVSYQGGAAAAVQIQTGKGSVALENIYALGTTLTALAGAVVVDP